MDGNLKKIIFSITLLLDFSVKVLWKKNLLTLKYGCQSKYLSFSCDVDKMKTNVTEMTATYCSCGEKQGEIWLTTDQPFSLYDVCLLET